MEVDRAHCTMVGGGMMFGKVVGEITFSPAPKDLELVLSHSVSHPVKAHVDGFGALLFYRVIDNAFSARVVGLDGCWWLWVV